MELEKEEWNVKNLIREFQAFCSSCACTHTHKSHSVNKPRSNGRSQDIEIETKKRLENERKNTPILPSFSCCPSISHWMSKPNLNWPLTFSAFSKVKKEKKKKNWKQERQKNVSESRSNRSHLTIYGRDKQRKPSEANPIEKNMKRKKTLWR